MTDLVYLLIANLAFSGGGLLYLIKVETRFARLEVQMGIVMKQYNLMDGPGAQ